MATRGSLFITAAAVGALAAPALAQQSGPVATYWVSASTSTGMGGMGAGMSGRGSGDQDQQPQQQQPKPKRPGLGSMLGAAASSMVPGAGLFGNRGGGSNDSGSNANGGGGANDYMARMGGGGTPIRQLTLQLGSIAKPTGDPTAEHLIPTGMNMGPSLPLVTPEQPAPQKADADYSMPDQMRKPEGKMLIYWGCGEHAAAAPIVLDFATMAQGQLPKLPMIEVKPERPPSSSRSATYGDWPNRRDTQRVPADASLAGDHMVRGDYTPDIKFHLGPEHDFMAPLTITSKYPTPGGALKVTWNAVPGATGYYAMLMGADSQKGGGDGHTMVMWTSSMKANSFGPLLDYLPPSEVRRLVAEQAVMRPETTECIIPEEVESALGLGGMFQMIAYGDEVNFADPPRPSSPKAAWNVKTVVKVRFKSTTSMILGMDRGSAMR
ncbi:MAG TPA: hypothetical protein VG407_14950 [Caulobacteraceae bacterium]|jgi:hypothetical protein|nr:hypothetical protein [Caulobacteraceae bacterium]